MPTYNWIPISYLSHIANNQTTHKGKQATIIAYQKIRECLQEILVNIKSNNYAFMKIGGQTRNQFEPLQHGFSGPNVLQRWLSHNNCIIRRLK